jgi:AcrR family transcriptional regulator
MPPPRTAPRRADAQKNRERILEVARAALTASDDTSLNAITKRAGVGAGTFYRHFPTREALVLAVYHRDVETIVDAAPALLNAHPPIEAFRLWCGHLAETGQIKHGLGDALTAVHEDEHAAPVLAAIELLLDACKRSGAARRDLVAYDVLLLLSFLWRMEPAADWRRRADRLLDVVIAGMHP